MLNRIALVFASATLWLGLTICAPASAQVTNAAGLPTTHGGTNFTNTCTLAASNATCAVPTNGYGDWSAQIVTTNLVGTVSFYGTVDGFSHVAPLAARTINISGYTAPTDGSFPTSFTGTGSAVSVIFHGTAAPFTQVEVAMTAFTSGSAVATVNTTQAVSAVILLGAPPNTTSPGTSASKAQGVQGVTSGVPLPITGTVNIGNFPGATIDGNGNQYVTPRSGTNPQSIDSGGRAGVGRVATQFVILAAGTYTSSHTSSTLSVGSFTECVALSYITASSGTSPTWQVQIDESLDGGTTWVSDVAYAPAYSAYGQLFSFGTGTSANISLGDTIRVRVVISGTTPSLTGQTVLICK
jgi:hypothetical protein